MFYVGADLHKKSITFCVVTVVDGRIQIVRQERILCHRVDMLRSFLAKSVPFQITVEATIGYDWFAALAEEYAQRVVLAHPGKLRIIAESTRKTDKIDARVLAEFLSHDMIPEAWRPTPRVRQHRSLVRRRQKIQSRITSIKNTIRGVLTRYNADRVDVFTRRGWMATTKVALLEEERWLLNHLWQDLLDARERLSEVDQRLQLFASQAPLKELEARAILATFPGIGRVTVEVLLAELGDWERFASADAVVSFAGLDPGVRESDGRRHELHLTKAGSPLLRWILIQLAHRVKRMLMRWQVLFSRLSQRLGKKKATCAIARRLLLVLYAMLRDGQTYRMPAVAPACS